MNFECPYCHRPTTITDPNRDSDTCKINVAKSVYGPSIGYNIFSITCPNKDCNELYLYFTFGTVGYLNGDLVISKPIKQRRLLPDSSAKVLPDYIPEAIKEDYYEACRIQNLSPKASATLSRRCLQGMIRDFWSISGKHKLFEEINAIKTLVDPEVRDAIDAVRKIGNIGAHMEQDINLIIDVDPEEAGALIQLIELLMDERYVARQKRREKTQKVKDIAQDKNDAKNG